MVDVPEVHLDGLDGDEQGLGDIAVAHGGGGHGGDAVLGRGQGVHSAYPGPADAGAGGHQLLGGTVAEGGGAGLAGDGQGGLKRRGVLRPGGWPRRRAAP